MTPDEERQAAIGQGRRTIHDAVGHAINAVGGGRFHEGFMSNQFPRERWDDFCGALANRIAPAMRMQPVDPSAHTITAVQQETGATWIAQFGPQGKNLAFNRLEWLETFAGWGPSRLVLHKLVEGGALSDLAIAHLLGVSSLPDAYQIAQSLIQRGWAVRDGANELVPTIAGVEAESISKVSDAKRQLVDFSRNVVSVTESAPTRDEILEFANSHDDSEWVFNFPASSSKTEYYRLSEDELELAIRGAFADLGIAPRS